MTNLKLAGELCIMASAIAAFFCGTVYIQYQIGRLKKERKEWRRILDEEKRNKKKKEAKREYRKLKIDERHKDRRKKI